jgi:hypothetical protein
VDLGCGEVQRHYDGVGNFRVMGVGFLLEAGIFGKVGGPTVWWEIFCLWRGEFCFMGLGLYVLVFGL